MRTEGKKGPAEILYRCAVVGLLVCLFPLASYLAYNAVRYTCTVEYPSQQVWLELDEPLEQVGVFLLFCVGVVILDLLLRKLKSAEERIGIGVLIAACAITLFVGLGYIWQHPYKPSGDQLIVAAAAAYFRDGNYSMLAEGGYLGMFPRQKGLVFLYEIIFSIFGNYNYKAIQLLHVLYYTLTLPFGYFMLKNFSIKAAGRILYCMLMTCCLPYLIYIPYLYGDFPAVFFSIILFWAISAYEKKYQKRYLLFAVMAGAIALMLRQSILVVLIAVGIGMILTAVRRCCWKPVIAAICIIGISLGGIEAIGILYEKQSGYPRNVGIPQIVWIDMGMQELRGMPGRYNRYPQNAYEQGNWDRELTEEIGKEYLKGRIEEFRSNTLMAKDFFHRKLQQQWIEPTFESFCYTSTFEEGQPIPRRFESLYYGRLNNYAQSFANGYQSIVYLAFWMFVIGKIADLIQKNGWRDKSQEGAFWIPLIAIVGGFLFSLIWESKCRYVFPYYMYMLLYAPIGLCGISDAVCGLWVNVKRAVKAGKKWPVSEAGDEGKEPLCR